MLLFLLTILGAFVLGFFMPWWSIAIPGFVLGIYYRPKPVLAFLLGFMALFLLWGGQAWIQDSGNAGLLSDRIAGMIGIGNPFYLILATALIGGIVSGLAAYTGAAITHKPEVKKKKR